ncbi:MAG: hypothetical protein KC517_09185 [Bacteroidetes bacterium]|nr:hypothetical protein [Bacteroidota bacterium]
MFESALYEKLISDGILAERLAVYNGKPAVFSGLAPEDAERPWITFSITRYNTESIPVDRFNVYIDYFDNTVSSKEANEAIMQIDIMFDNQVLNNERYDHIRFYRVSSGSVPEDDRRKLHYNFQFSARAGRKAWMEQP